MELFALREQYVSAATAEKPRVFRELLLSLGRALHDGRDDEAAAVIRSTVGPEVDYTTAQALRRVVIKFRRRTKAKSPVRLAVLGSSTTGPLADLLDLMLFAAGLDAEIYQGEY